jgi:transposase
MEIQPFLTDPAGVLCDVVRFGSEIVTLKLTAIKSAVLCPGCGQPSHRIHSRYTRTLADLPWMGTPVRLQLQVRRFFCDTSTCSRTIFAERLSQAAAHARKTSRLIQALCQIGLALGGQAGSHLAGHLNMSVSGDTLLRLVRRAPSLTLPAVSILGVDDWAWHKGLRYGTILCDLERHHPVDLLPERSAEGLSNWLIAHPGVRVISRDRGGCYAQGARTGAPQAMQVADRFHLLCNLRKALMRALDRHHHDLREAARTAAACHPLPVQPIAQALSVPQATPPALAQQAKEISRSRRLERYDHVMDLHQQRISTRQIARQMGMHRCTVRRFLRAGQFPERAARKYIKRTDHFVEYLRQRWEQGCRNAKQLARELAQQGFDGSYCMVRRFVAAWREPDSAHIPGPKPTAEHCPPVQHHSANQAAWLLLKDAQDRTEEENAFVEVLWQRCPEFKIAAGMAQEFARMANDRKAELLDGWIVRTHGSQVPHELRIFADGLKRDFEAVKAALSLEWSNGQVEGQINRLKMIKRQMYGRAGFDLLRQRVLNVG